MNESLNTVQGRSVVRIERRFAHAREKLWQALTDPEELRHWFPARVSVDLRVGGAMQFEFEDGAGPALEGRVLDLDPPSLFCFGWGDSVLRFELADAEGPSGPGCLMVFSHTFGDRASAASFAAGWQICFDHLGHQVAGVRAEVGLAQWADLHEFYVERFRLDIGTLLGDPAQGWEVRFERQLTRPVEKVWRVVTGGGDPVAGGEIPAPLAAACSSATVAAVEAPKLIELVTGDGAGRVRWELAPGNGGARLALSQVFPASQGDAARQALEDWGRAIASLASELRPR